MMKPGFFKRLYTPQSLFQLFMVCAFPLHAWTLFAAFRDFAWVALRTYTWDAIGLVSYALAFALVETIGVFLLVLLMGLLVPASWEMDKRTAIIGTMFLVIASWSILSQIYSSFGYPLPNWLLRVLMQSMHPLRILWGAILPVVTLSVVVPIILVVKREQAKKLVIGFFERISVLSSFYIFLDLLGIIIIIVRNMHK